MVHVCMSAAPVSLLRHIAQVSVQMSQDHIAQAFHFLITKRSVVAGALAAGVSGAEAAAASEVAMTKFEERALGVVFLKGGREVREMRAFFS